MSEKSSYNERSEDNKDNVIENIVVFTEDKMKKPSKIPKKRKTCDKGDVETKTGVITSAMEPARAVASEKHLNISFEKYVIMAIKSYFSEKNERKKTILGVHNDRSAIIKLINETHSLLHGSTMQIQTAMCKALESSSADDAESSSTDTLVNPKKLPLLGENPLH